MWVPVQPRKVGFRDENHQGGVEPEIKGTSSGLNQDVGPSSIPKSRVNPEKLCSEMKGNSGGLNQDVGPGSRDER